MSKSWEVKDANSFLTMLHSENAFFVCAFTIVEIGDAFRIWPNKLPNFGKVFALRI